MQIIKNDIDVQIKYEVYTLNLNVETFKTLTIEKCKRIANDKN